MNLRSLVAFTHLVVWFPGFMFCGEGTTSALTFWDLVNGHKQLAKIVQEQVTDILIG